MTLSTEEIEGIVLVVVLGVILAGLFLYILRRLRQRRDHLVKELQTPELRQDRAFNRIAMARREAEILARTGADVTTARSLIAQAQGAFDTRDFDGAYRNAQEAHEALVAVRRDGPLPGRSVGPARPVPSSSPLPSGTGPARAEGPTGPAPPPKIPKNRAESQFQLRLLDQELQEARASRPNDGAVAAADALRSQAQAAFDREDFTEAFRLSLRGRRQLGGHVEALPPTPTAAPTGAGRDVTPATGVDALASADRAAGASRCPECGFPLLPDDRFCRGCGKPRGVLTCPACEAPRDPADTFCGRCGARFS
ncbi:MAG TPA: zinc ribbon domain-containing protein [Thermoplasmata archaeon]|nr:zinc ribbon domain-containing protein [Thermoplasmata archaeon]